MSYLVIQNHGVCYIWLIVQYIVPLEVFTGSFWMGAFNGNTAKRHRLWSNDQGLLQEIVKQGGFCCPHLNRYFWLDLKSSEVVSFSLHELSQVGTWHGVRCNVCRVQTWAWSASTWTRRAKKESLDCLRNSGRASGLSATCNMCVCASLTCECMPLQVFVSCAFSLTCNIMELRQGLYSRLWKVHCEIGHGGS